MEKMSLGMMNVSKTKNKDEMEREEGEIVDGTEYEDISSEEEYSMRERIAELEARNKELQQIDTIAETSFGYVLEKGIEYGKENVQKYIQISDDEDDAIFVDTTRHTTKTNRPANDRSSVNRLKAKNRVIVKSPAYRLIERTEKHRLAKRKYEKYEKHKKVIHQRHKKRKHSSHVPSKRHYKSSESDSDYELDRSKLDAACKVDNKCVRSRNALKDKLSMINRDKNKDTATVPITIDEEDEEMQLRLVALQSKQEMREIDAETIVEPPSGNEINSEEHELRLIALKSAYVKKHEARMKRRRLENDRPYSPTDKFEILENTLDLDKVMPDDMDDIQIIEETPIVVEIPSSSDDEDDMEISPASSPIPILTSETFPQPIDMDLATSGDSKSPTAFTVELPEIEEPQDTPIEVPLNKDEVPMDIEVEPNDDKDAQTNEDEDEEALRSLLLSKFSPSPTRTVLTKKEDPKDNIDLATEAESLRSLLLLSLKSKKSSQTTADEVDQKLPQIEMNLKNAVKRLQVSCSKDNIENRNQNTSLTSVLEIELKTIASANVPASIVNLKQIASNLALQKKADAPLKAVPTATIQPESMAATRKIVKRKRKKSLTVKSLPPKPVELPKPIPLPIPLALPKVTNTSKLVNNPNKLINLQTYEKFISPQVPKIVIQLGHSDSDSDSDYYPRSSDEIGEKCAPNEVDCLKDIVIRENDNASPSHIMLDSPTYSPAPPDINADEISEPLASTPSVTVGESPPKTAGFEERLELFLKTVRSKIDQTNTEVAAKTKTKMIQKTPVTPLAVRHLPQSSQLEYKRLVARMALLEKQKQTRLKSLNTSKKMNKMVLKSDDSSNLQVIIQNDEEGSAKNHDIIITVNNDKRNVQDISASTLLKPDSLVKKVLIKNTATTALSETTKKDGEVITSVDQNHNDALFKRPSPVSPIKIVPSPSTSQPKPIGPKVDKEFDQFMENVKRLPEMSNEDQLKILHSSERKYQIHSKLFMHDLNDIIATVTVTQKERQKQYYLENKVEYLRERLAKLEPVLEAQKRKLAKIFPALQSSHQGIMQTRNKCINLNNVCVQVGKTLKGQSYQIPSNMRTEILGRLRTLSNETKKLKNMKKMGLEEFKAHVWPSYTQIRQTDDSADSESNIPESPASPDPPPAEPNTQEEEPTEPIEEPNNHEAPKFERYSSPLDSLASKGPKNNPDGVMCPFQLLGQCEDKDCNYEHFIT